MYLLFLTLQFLSAATFACTKSSSQDDFGNTVTSYIDNKMIQNAGYVLILPPTGGANVADQNLAEKICESGTAAIILDYKQEVADLLDISSHDRIAQGVLNTVNSFIKNQNRKLVLIGSSLGGLYASMAFGLSQSSTYDSFHFIQATVLTVAGGSLAEIQTQSQLESVKKQRDARFAKYQFKNDQEYIDVISPQIQIDPILFANKSLSNNVLMFASSKDVIVPTFTQDHLWNAWGQPERKIYSTNHMYTIARVYYFQTDTIIEFVIKNLN